MATPCIPPRTDSGKRLAAAHREMTERVIAVLCAQQEQWMAWTKRQNALRLLNRARAEGEGWAAYRITEPVNLVGRHFNEVVLLEGYDPRTLALMDGDMRPFPKLAEEVAA